MLYRSVKDETPTRRQVEYQPNRVERKRVSLDSLRVMVSSEAAAVFAKGNISGGVIRRQCKSAAVAELLPHSLFLRIGYSAPLSRPRFAGVFFDARAGQLGQAGRTPTYAAGAISALPEGDTVHKVARLLAKDLSGQILRRVQARRLDVRCLTGARVVAVASAGKHLSIDCDNGVTLRSHLGMYGSWHRYAPGERWQRPTWQASLVLATDAQILVCFNAKDVEILASQGWRRRDALDHIGPDLACTHASPATLLARLDALVAPETLLADLLLDQRIAAGIGNVYKCEVMFLAGLAPVLRRSDLPSEALVGLYDLASDLIRGNLGVGPRITRQTSDGRTGLWVYRRAGQPCLRCGDQVRCDRLGVKPRLTYWCPGCQGGAA